MHCSCTFFPPNVFRSKVLVTSWNKGGSVSRMLSSGIMLAWLPCSNYELFPHVIQRKQTSLRDLSHLLKINAAKLFPSYLRLILLRVLVYILSDYTQPKFKTKMVSRCHLKALNSNVYCYWNHHYYILNNFISHLTRVKNVLQIYIKHVYKWAIYN